MKKLFIVLAILFCASAVQAAEVTLAWDAVADTRVSGYNLYYGTTSRVYGPAIPTGKVTQFKLTSIEEEKNLYFAVTALASSENLESPYSVELPCWTLVPTAGSGGAISPSATKVVSAITPQTFTVTPNTGYKINDVTVDGTSVGKVSTYTFSNVSTSHTIKATFVAVVPLPAPDGLKLSN